MALARVSSSSRLPLPSSTTSSMLHSLLRPLSTTSSIWAPRFSHPRSFVTDVGSSQVSPASTAKEDGDVIEAPRSTSRRPWKPMCLYYTQGKCTMETVSHLYKDCPYVREVGQKYGNDVAI